MAYTHRDSTSDITSTLHSSNIQTYEYRVYKIICRLSVDSTQTYTCADSACMLHGSARECLGIWRASQIAKLARLKPKRVTLAPVEQYDARIAQAYRYIASNILLTRLGVRDVKNFLQKFQAKSFLLLTLLIGKRKAPSISARGLKNVCRHSYIGQEGKPNFKREKGIARMNSLYV